MARRKELREAIRVVKEMHKNTSTKALNQTREVLKRIDGFGLEVEALTEVINQREHRRLYMNEYYYKNVVLVRPAIFSRPSSLGERTVRVVLDDDEENQYY